MYGENTHERSDDLTPFELRVKGFVQRALKTLCQKGYTPLQSLNLISEKEARPVFKRITWAAAEAILFVEMSQRYGHLVNHEMTNVFEFLDVDDVSAKDEDSSV